MSASVKSESRRAFLARLRAVPETPHGLQDDQIRPPWARRVMGECTACGDCMAACPEGIIIADDKGRPAIDFTKGECTFCSACVDVCREPVFDRDHASPWQLDVAVASSCFAERGIFCRSCGDACPERAIRIMPQLGGRARVIIDETACTGCGACLGACPAEAIEITPAQEAPHG